MFGLVQSGRDGATAGMRVCLATMAFAVVSGLLLIGPPSPVEAMDMAPVRGSFEGHKLELLALEASLRNSPDSALSGVPGAALVLFSCDGSGCIGPHHILLDGHRDDGLDRWLDLAFPAGGWVPLVLPPGDQPMAITWSAGGKGWTVHVPPSSGRVVVVRRDGEGVGQRTVTPTPEHAVLVALAMRARGDQLGALAVLAAAEQHLGANGTGQQLMMAGLLREAGMPSLARRTYERVLDDVAGSGDSASDAAVRARLGLAGLAFDDGDFEAVLRWLTTVSLPPGHHQAGARGDLLIRTYVALGRDREAVELPVVDDPFVRANRAMAFHALGDTFTAVTELERAIRLCSNSVPEEVYLRERLLLTLGTIQAEQGKLPEAVRTLERMSPDGPFGDRYRFARGVAFYNNNERIKAVAEFKALEAHSPDSPYALEGLLVMGEAYRALNAPRQAVAEFRKALDRFNRRGRAIDFLLAESKRGGFDEGLTGLIFTGDWRRADLGVQPRLGTGLRILFATPDLSAHLDEHRQISLILERLEALKRYPSVRADPALMARLDAGLQGVYVFRGLFQAAARELLVDTLTAARSQAEELAVAASLGLSQSVLFDSTGRSELVFGAGR